MQAVLSGRFLDLATPRCGKCGFLLRMKITLKIHESSLRSNFRESAPEERQSMSSVLIPIRSMQIALSVDNTSFRLRRRLVWVGIRDILKSFFCRLREHPVRAAGFALGQLLGAQLDASQFSRVVTVPMHWRRRLIELSLDRGDPRSRCRTTDKNRGV